MGIYAETLKVAVLFSVSIKQIEPQYTDIEKPRFSYKGTTLKSIAVDQLGNTSDISISSLFIENIEQFTLPIINIATPEKNLYDYEHGILVAGLDYDSWLKNNTSGKKLMYKTPANYRRGSADAKKTNAIGSFFFNDAVINSKIKIRTHGGASRAFPVKSIRIYPDKNSKELRNVNILGDNNFNNYRINLRNAGNRFKHDYMKDAAIHKISNHLNFGTQRSNPVILFINGEYQGLRHARDRKDTHYLVHTYSLPTRNVELISIKENRNTDQYTDILTLFTNTDFKKTSSYNLIENHFDLDSFIDYFFVSIFTARDDWPGNNIAIWRYIGKPQNNNKFTDGKWRYLLYDTDHSRHFNFNSIKYAVGEHRFKNAPDWSTELFRNFIKNPTIREKFVIRSSDLMNSWLQPKRTTGIIRQTEASIEHEMPRHIKRWSNPESIIHWRQSVNSLVKFFEQRPKHQWQHLEEFFNLEGLYQVQINTSQAGSGRIQLNTLNLGDDPALEYEVTDTPLFFPWQGQYFKKLPLTLEALPAKGYTFSHWQIEGADITQEQAQSTQLVLHPEQDVQITAVMVEVH